MKAANNNSNNNNNHKSYTFADILEWESINEVHDDTVPVEVPGGGHREPTVLQGFHVCKFLKK